MPLFLRKKLPEGGYRLEPADPEGTLSVPLPPPDVTMGTKIADKRFRCKACKATFAGRGVLSMHFARQHKDLYTDKDSWQAYVENIA